MLGVKPGGFRGSTSLSSHVSPPAGPSREASEGSSIELLSDSSVRLPIISEADLYPALRELGLAPSRSYSQWMLKPFLAISSVERGQSFPSYISNPGGYSIAKYSAIE